MAWLAIEVIQFLPSINVYYIIVLPLLIRLRIHMVYDIIIKVVFAGFSSESLAQRIIDCKPKVLMTCNAAKRGSKAIFLKDIVDAALIQSANHGHSIGICLFQFDLLIQTILFLIH